MTDWMEQSGFIFNFKYKIYDKFKVTNKGVLISTDVCARGVDF